MGEAKPPYSSGRFYLVSQRFARSAADAYTPDDSPFFFLHAGASVELGLKAVLCRITPALLVDGGSGSLDRSIVELVGYGSQSLVVRRGGTPPSAPPRRPFTVSLARAIARFELIYGVGTLGVTPDQLDEIKAARDMTAHGDSQSDSPGSAMARVMYSLATIHDVIAPLLGSTPERFWGDHYGFVQRAKRISQNNVRSQVEALYAAARARFDAKYAGLDEDSLRPLLDAYPETIPGKNEMPRKCPVCSAAGVATERAAKRTIVTSKDEIRIARGWVATDFYCSVCRLVLENEELVKAAPDFDPWEYVEDDTSLDFWIEDTEAAVLNEEHGPEPSQD